MTHLIDQRSSRMLDLCKALVRAYKELRQGSLPRLFALYMVWRIWIVVIEKPELYFIPMEGEGIEEEVEEDD